jgi:tRNA(His) 5'-end guanylyltransferase
VRCHPTTTRIIKSGIVFYREKIKKQYQQEGKKTNVAEHMKKNFNIRLTQCLNITEEKTLDC